MIKSANASAKADVNVRKLELPIMTITKANLQGSPSVQTSTDTTPSYITYEITVTNDETVSNVDFENPVVIDILPTGVTFFEDATHPVKIEEGIVGNPFTTSTMTVVDKLQVEGAMVNETSNGDYRDPETALIFKLKGTLAKGYSLRITFSAEVTENALLYEREGRETTIRNDAYLSSWDKAPKTVDNPNGYSYATGVGSNGKYQFGDQIADHVLHQEELRRHSGRIRRLQQRRIQHESWLWRVHPALRV